MTYEESFLALVNAQNNTSFTLTDLRLGKPRVATVPEGSPVNTIITVYGLSEAGYYGNYDFTYRRIDLAKTFAGRNPVAQVRSGVVTIHDIITSLNERYGIELLPNDFIHHDPVEGSSMATLEVIPDSVFWLPGSVQVELEVQMVEVASDISSPDLDGFKYLSI